MHLEGLGIDLGNRMGLYGTMQEHTGPYGTIWDHTRPYGTVYGTIWDHTGPYRTIWDPYWTIRNHPEAPRVPRRLEEVLDTKSDTPLS